MHGEWCGVCDFVVLSVVEVCVDYGVGVCVNVCSVVCVVVCCLFLTFGCCLLCCSGWVVILVLSVMGVVGGVPLWVECVCFVV